MKPIKVLDILNAAGGKLLCGSENIIVTNVCTDSRKIEKDSVFIPLRGERFDGHIFLEEAVKQGCTAVLTEHDKVDFDAKDAAVIGVENTLRALGKIAEYYRSLYNIPAVSLTGSVGKTTTKEMTYSVLSQKYNVLKNKGNFNNEIGVPLTLFELSDEYDMLIAEMGMSGFGEIGRLSAMIRPDVVFMTNIGMSHIELLGSQENIYKAKSEFLKNMPPEGTVVLNGDDEILMSHAPEIDKKLLTVGIKNKQCDFVAENIRETPESVSFTLKTAEKSIDINLSVPGVHNIYNALFACAAGMIFNVGEELIKKGLSEFIQTDMRLSVINTESFTIINDCYNAAPDSVKAALGVLGAREGRKVAILGDIACLGEYSYEAHRGLGAEVVKNGIDVLVTIGNEARFIAESAFENGMASENIFSFDDCGDAIKKLAAILNIKDTVLIKASRVMRLERVVDAIKKL